MPMICDCSGSTYGFSANLGKVGLVINNNNQSIGELWVCLLLRCISAGYGDGDWCKRPLLSQLQTTPLNPRAYFSST